MQTISKTDFKAHALEILREIEKTGNSRVITDRGKPTLEIRILRQNKLAPLQRLKGTVVKYEDPMAPIVLDDWENA